MQLFQSHNTPRKRVQITFPKKGKTKQSFKDQCDINIILAKYDQTGALGHLNKATPNYGYATSENFAEAMRTVTDAQTGFQNLSEKIKNRFDNNPGKLLDFVQDPANKQEGAELGLWPKDSPTQLLEPPTPPEPKKTPPPDKKAEPKPKKD